LGQGRKGHGRQKKKERKGEFVFYGSGKTCCGISDLGEGKKGPDRKRCTKKITCKGTTCPRAYPGYIAMGVQNKDLTEGKVREKKRTEKSSFPKEIRKKAVGRGTGSPRLEPNSPDRKQAERKTKTKNFNVPI